MGMVNPRERSSIFRGCSMGGEWVKLGWMLDPLTAVMLVMVCFVGLLIFIYSTGYMSHDENFTRSSAFCRCLRARCWGW